ncbi:hypothetical protein [Anatilimnocola floriformis]|uniref:hypothetical protein n=1 Tax=Anatilimnocola floriformis TaxID=2948575 RepID=UPI0020C52A83|nr:hypothetical protein [Anatilimnocola floriformis]
MSFDPIHDPLDDPNFDGELPDDFAALSEQLQCDAQRLSSVYPACQAPTKLMEALAAEPRSWWQRRRLPLGVSAAAALLLVCGLTLIVLSRGSQQTAQPEANLPPENAVVSVPVVSNPVNDADLTPVSFRPALVDVNGPELEGLLDLWQEQSPVAGRIAF